MKCSFWYPSLVNVRTPASRKTLRWRDAQNRDTPVALANCVIDRPGGAASMRTSRSARRSASAMARTSASRRSSVSPGATVASSASLDLSRLGISSRIAGATCIVGRCRPPLSRALEATGRSRSTLRWPVSLSRSSTFHPPVPFGFAPGHGRRPRSTRLRRGSRWHQR